MENKLTEKKLLHWLANEELEHGWMLENEAKQIYNQLIEIVKESKNWMDEDGQFLCLFDILEAYKLSLEQQKPIVTLAEIRELSARLRDTSRQTLYETKLKRWLESKGFEVKDEE